MKKGKIMLAFMLVIALLLGTQAYAQEGDAVPEVSMTMDTSAEDGTVNVGDTLQFTLTAANPGGMTDLGGSFLRFRVSGTEDMTDRVGNPQIQTKSEYLTDPSNGNGIAVLRVDSQITGEAKAVVSMEITEDMKGKTLYFQTDLCPDFAEAEPFAQTDVISVQVADESIPSGNADLGVSAILYDIDVNNDKIVKGEAIPAELKVTNTGDVPLEYIYASIGYSQTGIENDEADMMPIGTFAYLPENVTQPEDGVACIASLGAGESVTLTAFLTVPETYSEEDIVFTFMAVSYGMEDFEETDIPLAFGYVEMKGMVAQEAAEEPDPGTENPPAEDPDETKPVKEETPKNPASDTKKNDDAKSTQTVKAPKTGETASVAGLAVVMLGAMMVIGISAQRKYK